MGYRFGPMLLEYIPGVVALQREAFPAPFDEELLWKAEHLESHLAVFPTGQFVALDGDQLVGSCSNTLVTEEVWQAHGSWIDTVGGPCLETFTPEGKVLYGLDISVHPEYRMQGIGKQFYSMRFDLVRSLGEGARYGTACRMPDYAAWTHFSPGTPEAYAAAVTMGFARDRTLTPLLRYGLTYLGVIENYMEDAESGNAAALLEWLP